LQERDRKLIKLLYLADKEDPECRYNPDIFFPEEFTEQGTATRETRLAAKLAKQMCARCPIQKECLDYAMTAKEEFGVWGGTTRYERR